MQGLARKLKQQESFSGFGAADLNDVEEVDSASDGGTDAEHTASPGQLLAPLARPPIRLEVTVHMDGSEERVRLEVSRRIGAAADARGWRVEGEVVVRAGGSGAWVVVVSLVGPRGEQEARKHTM